jgi:hypothetical protein
MSTTAERVESLAEYAARIAAEAPPLSPAQRDRLAVLLRGTTKWTAP